MIETDILDIVADASDNGERLNALVDQFRRGRDVTDLLRVLNAEDPEFVSIGAWVLSELPFDLYDSDEMVSRLHELLDHDNPAVRFNALGALFPALDGREPLTQALLRKMCGDPNEGVRRSAEAAASKLLRQ